MKATLLETDYTTKAGKSVIRMLLKKNKFIRAYFPDFEPYFFVFADPSKREKAKRALESLELSDRFGEEMRVIRVEEETHLLFGKTSPLLKVFCSHPKHVKMLREKARLIGDVYEADIVFPRRFLIDKGVKPFQTVTLFGKQSNITKIVPDGFANTPLRTLAFDIEVYNPKGSPRPEKDQIIMISYAFSDGSGVKSGVITTKDIPLKFIHKVKDEAAMLTEFSRILKENDVELLVGYNDAEFDLPYMRDRARKLGVPLKFGRDTKPFQIMQHGLFKRAKITGRLHVDLYGVARFLSLALVLKTNRLTLGEVYNELFGDKGEEKKKVDKLAIWKLWDGDESELRTLAEYSLDDSLAELRVAERLLPLQTELAKIVGASLQETCGATTGQLVELLLWREAHDQNRIVPNKPSGEEVARRASLPVQGAFVKLPEAGIYNDLAILDFRGMYPSIIISHNIDMDTLDCACCPGEKAHISPAGHRFCSSKKGLIPSVLEKLIDERSELKKKLATLKKDSPEYVSYFVRSQGLKILSNSFYGYMLYARSRWYSRPCGESVTAYGRQYIQDTIKKAEDAGFKVIYSDTDSIVIQLNGNRPDVLKFMEKTNKSLPGRMELELESFYPRGVFVGKKLSGQKAEVGAKKKYALIDDTGRIKIRGFELVRRDWSKIARRTQRRVLEAILKDGSKEKAESIVREVITSLRTGNVPLDDCIIYTQIRRNLKSYAITSPEVAAAQKLVASGTPVEIGTLVGYVVTKNGKTISEKAQPIQLAKDYDPKYYVEHQVIPSVLKIMKELGFSEEDLKAEGKQSGLGSW